MTMKSLSFAIAAITISICISCKLQHGYAASSVSHQWSQNRYNPKNAAQGQDKDFHGKIVWRTNLPGGLCLGPALTKNAVFVSNSKFSMIAIDRANGKILFQRAARFAGAIAPPLVNGKTILIESFHEVRAIDSRTYKSKWVFSTRSTLFTPLSVANGCVFAQTTNGTLFCINASTGTRILTFQRPGTYMTKPVNSKAGLIITRDNNIYCYNVYAKRLQWARQVDTPIYISPVISAGKLFVEELADSQGRYSVLFALDINSGSTLWTKALTPQVISHLPLATSASGQIYFAIGKQVSCLGIANQVLLWSHTMDEQITTGPSITRDGAILLGTKTGLTILDAVGSVSKKIHLTGGIYSDVGIGNTNDAYVLTGNKQLLRID